MISETKELDLDSFLSYFAMQALRSVSVSAPRVALPSRSPAKASLQAARKSTISRAAAVSQEWSVPKTEVQQEAAKVNPLAAEPPFTLQVFMQSCIFSLQMSYPARC